MISEQLQQIHHRIKKAATNAIIPRDVNDITLIAVSKTVPIDRIEQAILAGHSVFGENRVQEAIEKWEPLKKKYPHVQLHLIGPLQSNKVAQAVKLFDVIETIDRGKIAKMVAEECQKQHKKLPCLVQVNIGEEPQKSGVNPMQTINFVKECREIYGLTISGLMCVPPHNNNPSPYFVLLSQLAHQAHCNVISMGMSQDFEIAIKYGATSIRLGRIIFGNR